jgi:hypothetical protein
MWLFWEELLWKEPLILVNSEQWKVNSCGKDQLKKDAELNSASNAMQGKWTMLRKWIVDSEQWTITSKWIVNSEQWIVVEKNKLKNSSEFIWTIHQHSNSNNLMEKLKLEYEAFGTFISAHPFDWLYKYIKRKYNFTSQILDEKYEWDYKLLWFVKDIVKSPKFGWYFIEIEDLVWNIRFFLKNIAGLNKFDVIEIQWQKRKKPSITKVRKINLEKLLDKLKSKWKYDDKETVAKVRASRNNVLQVNDDKQVNNVSQVNSEEWTITSKWIVNSEKWIVVENNKLKKDAELNSAWQGSCHSELVSESNAMQSKWTMLRKWIDNSEKWKLETGFQDFAGFQDNIKQKTKNKKQKLETGLQDDDKQVKSEQWKVNSCGKNKIKKDAELNSVWQKECYSEPVSESESKSLQTSSDLFRPQITYKEVIIDLPEDIELINKIVELKKQNPNQKEFEIDWKIYLV